MLTRSSLTPTYYIYLNAPLFADGEELILYTLQEMCLKELLTIKNKTLPKSNIVSKEVDRYYFEINRPRLAQLRPSRSELFVLSVFKQHEEISFPALFLTLKQLLGNQFDTYKKQFIKPEIKELGFFSFAFFISSTAHQEIDFVADQLKFIDKNIDRLLAENRIEQELNKLGLNILLLQNTTLQKLPHFDARILLIQNLEALNAEVYEEDESYTVGDLLQSYLRHQNDNRSDIDKNRAGEFRYRK